MGKIKTNGNASCTAIPDWCKYSFAISEYGKSTAEVSKRISASCETFLRAMTKVIKDSSVFKFEKDTYSSSDSGGDRVYCVKRHLEANLPYNTHIQRVITATIEKANINVLIDMMPYCSKEKEMRKELLSDAIKQSKEIADIIASSQGERIIGIDKVNFSDRDFMGEWEELDNRCYSSGADYAGSALLFDEISVSEITYTEDVSVIWESTCDI